MSPRDVDVIGVGDAAVDIYLEVERIPEPDEKVRARSASRFPGGMAANFVVALGRLGSTCAFNGVVGDDELGREAIANLEANGVDVEAVVVRPGGTTYFCVVLLDPSGEKALVVAPTDCLFPAVEEVSESAIRRARHLHTNAQGIESAAAAASLAHGHGLTVSLDVEASAEADADDLRALLRHVDLLFAGADTARALTGAEALDTAAQRLAGLGPQIVCVTRGAAGSLVVTSDETIRADAYSVPVVDSTGAGDCFAAGFVHGFLAGWPLERTARFASAVGALSVMHRGGHAGAPRIGEVERFLERES